MGYVELSHVEFWLPDDRPLLSDVSFRVGDGKVTALIGPNGAGKTTLLRIIAGDLTPSEGTISRDGRLGVMRQFVGSIRDSSTVRDLLLSQAPERLQAASARVDALELELMESETDELNLAYAHALADYGDAGGYEAEVLFDACCTAALGVGFDQAKWRDVNTLSGGEQKRLVLELLFRGPDEVLLLDEPDNYLDVPGKLWLEEKLLTTQKSVLIVSHDRALLNRCADAIAALELGAAGNTLWVFGGRFEHFDAAREARFERFEELRRRWDEEHAKLRTLMLLYKTKAAYNDAMASRYQAAQTRLARFEDAGPPEAVPRKQQVRVRLTGGRTAKRAVVVESLELTGLMRPFSTEIWYGDRVGVLGSNGSGKSHFLRLLALGGTDPDPAARAVGADGIEPVRATGVARTGSRVRPGWFAQTNRHPELVGRRLLDILRRGDEHRDGLTDEASYRALDRYELAKAAEQPFETLSGGQQARVQILLLELGGATLLLLDEPTDNLDIESAEALEHGLAAFDGTVVAVTHDRWFARSLDRFLVFRSDGRVVASDVPVWDERRVERAR